MSHILPLARVRGNIARIERAHGRVESIFDGGASNLVSDVNGRVSVSLTQRDCVYRVMLHGPSTTTGYCAASSNSFIAISFVYTRRPSIGFKIFLPSQ